MSIKQLQSSDTAVTKAGATEVDAGSDAIERVPEPRKEEAEVEQEPDNVEQVRQSRREERRRRRELAKENDAAEDAPPASERRSQRREKQVEKEVAEKPADQPKARIKQGESKVMNAPIGLFRSAGASGRAASFVGQFNKFVKDNAQDADIQAFTGSNKLLLLRDIRTELVTFVALVSDLAGKLYYNLIVVENKESIVQDRNRKSDRRDRRRGRVNQDVREYRALPDMMDASVLGRINDYILENAGQTLSEDNLVYTGYTILGYNLELDNFDLLKPIIGSAYETNCEGAGLTEPLDNNFFKEEGIQLEAVVGMTGGMNAVGFGGQPIRNDVGLSIETFSNSDNRNPLDDGKEGQQWVTSSAFVDLVPVASLYSEGSDDRANRRVNINACLQPRVVITEVDIYQSQIRDPLLRMMLGIVPYIELSKNNRYLKPFMPRALGSRNDRDLSNLGFLMDPDGKVEPQRLDIENPNDDQEVYKFMEKLIRHDRGLEVAVRFTEGQPGSSTMTILQDIYDGDTDAENYLFDCLDDATGNIFSAEFEHARGTQVIAAAIELPDGYYLANGRQPITNIDHVATADALRGTDFERLDDFIECHSIDNGMDHDERMTRLVELYNHLTQDTFKMTGVSTMFIFDPVFLAAVYTAFTKAKMALRVDRDRDEVRGRRGNRSAASYGVQYDTLRTRDRGGRRDRDSGRDRDGRSRRARAWN